MITVSGLEWTVGEYVGVTYRVAEQPTPGRSEKAHKRNPLWCGYVEVLRNGVWVPEYRGVNQSPRGYTYGETQWTGLWPGAASQQARQWLELQVRSGAIR